MDLTKTASDPALLGSMDRWDAETSLRGFITYMWSILEPGRDFIPGWSVDAICEHLEAVTNGEIRRLLINVPPGCMKALDVDTPILTTWGWKTHGELRPGDYVFGPDGLPKRVLGHTQHRPEDSYRVVFDDKSWVIAGRGHLWEVMRDHGNETPRKRTRTVLTTEELHAGSRPDSIPLARPVQLAPKHLLIDPYLLGVWLGDGASNDGCIYAGAQDAPHFAKLGEISNTTRRPGQQSFYRVRIPGLRTKLRVSGLLNNKHIPEDYQEASVAQRWELLRGLMDSDGSCDKVGRCYFSQKSRPLTLQVERLVASLGMKARRREYEAKLYEKPYGTTQLLSFHPPPTAVVFHLARKQARVRPPGPRSQQRYLKAVEPVGIRTVNCIQVEGAIYLAGHQLVPTHNSLTTNVFWPAWEWGPRNLPTTRYVSSSYSEALTTRDNRRCRNLISSTRYQEAWGHRFQIAGDQNAKVRYDTDKTGFKIATSVGGLGTGERGDRFIIDDPHNIKESESDAARESALQWFTEVVPTRVNDPDKSAIIVIMQRVHERDISGLILREDLGYDFLCLPMEHEKAYRCYTPVKRPGIATERVTRVMQEQDPMPRWVCEGEELPRDYEPDWKELTMQDRREEEGELLWPDRFSQRHLEDDLKPALRAWGGSYAEAGQLQQRPAPRGGGMFQREDFNFVDKIPDGMTRITRGWDLASTKDAGAWTVGVKMGLMDGRIYILDVRRLRGSPGQVEDAFTASTEADGHRVIPAFPQDPGQAGKAQKASIAGKLHGYRVHFSPETGSKENRARPLAAQSEAGNLYLVRGSWNDVFVNEACLFPNGQFKDQIDAASRAYMRLIMKRPRRVGVAPQTIEIYNG